VRQVAGGQTPEAVAEAAGVCPRTVRKSALEPAEPIRRYEREHPGELFHIDIKKLGRIDGIGHRITGDRRGQSKVGQSEAQKEGRDGGREINAKAPVTP
jgi:hypothetical protein